MRVVTHPAPPAAHRALHRGDGEAFDERLDSRGVPRRRSARARFLDGLVRSGTTRIAEVAAHPFTSPATLLAAARIDAFAVAVAAPLRDRALLRFLLASESPAVRRMVAQNPTTAPWALAELCCDDDLAVLLTVAANRRTPQRALELLACSAQERVRAEVAQNPSTPDRVAAWLLVSVARSGYPAALQRCSELWPDVLAGAVVALACSDPFSTEAEIVALASATTGIDAPIDMAAGPFGQPSRRRWWRRGR